MYKGCVADSMTFSMDIQSPVIKVTLGGKYQWQSEDYDSTDDYMTDWTEYDADLIEWTCLYIDNVAIANVESMGFGVTTGADMIYGTCSRKAHSWYDKEAKFTVNATLYSDRPNMMRRLYSGGYTDSEGTIRGLSPDGVVEPLLKNLKPIENVTIKSERDTSNLCEIRMTKVTVNGNPFDAKQGNKLIDKPELSPRTLEIWTKTNNSAVTIT
jgi:hypothetical protein